jgi:hypothetical protein
MKSRSIVVGGVVGGAVGVMLATTGCCRIISELESSSRRDPSPTGPATELGVAVYPASASPSNSTNHTWRARPLRPDTYRLLYALDPGEASSVDSDLQAFATKVHYESQTKDRFRWRVPSGCGQGLGCVYQNLAARSLADVEPMVARFRARAREGHLSSLDVTELVVTFVQAIPYEIPEKEPFGVLPPALVASQRKGDCDSKALLAHMILHGLGVDTMMVSSNAHHHTMLGIALPAQGKSFKSDGRSYAFTEMTAKGSPIGHINPPLLSPDDWKPVAFAFPASSAGPSEKPKPKPKR